MTESVGARLRQARELRRLSLQEVSEATKVRTHYLQALENDDLSAIPSAAQARGFLRIYADFLALDASDSTSALPQEATGSVPAASVAPTAPDAREQPAGFWLGLRKRLKRGSKEDQAPEDSAAQASPVMPAETSVAAPPTEQLASTEVKTKVGARVRSLSDDVKKKSMK